MIKKLYELICIEYRASGYIKYKFIVLLLSSILVFKNIYEEVLIDID